MCGCRVVPLLSLSPFYFMFCRGLNVNIFYRNWDFRLFCKLHSANTWDFGGKFRDYFWIIRHYEFFFAIFLGEVLFFGALPLQRVDLTRHGVIEAKELIDRISATFLWQSPVRVGREKDNCEEAK